MVWVTSTWRSVWETETPSQTNWVGLGLGDCKLLISATFRFPWAWTEQLFQTPKCSEVLLHSQWDTGACWIDWSCPSSASKHHNSLLLSSQGMRNIGTWEWLRQGSTAVCKVFLRDPIGTGWITAQVNPSWSSHETFPWELESWGGNAGRSSTQISEITGHWSMACQQDLEVGRHCDGTLLPRDGCPQSPWRSPGFVSLVCAFSFMLMAETRDNFYCMKSITSSVSCPKT